ncbi:MAG: peroxide stress protein YaaA [Neisseria sp.]|nr:peroxide stress protein YaaA [Neisseria sp.]
MYFLLSPAKKLSETRDYPACSTTIPDFAQETQQLAQLMRHYAPHELADLMSISDKLALLNVERFADFGGAVQAAYPAVFLFNGDAYEGLNARTLSADGLAYLQTSLGLLSGLYGLLRPLDSIYPHRLEMGTRLENPKGKDLYAFWGDHITRILRQRMQAAGHSVLVNLASQEYFKAVLPERLGLRVVTPIFKDGKNGTYKTISFYAKRARGLMVRFATENALSQVEDLKAFDNEGYAFSGSLSDEHTWTFVRD